MLIDVDLIRFILKFHAFNTIIFTEAALLYTDVHGHVLNFKVGGSQRKTSRGNLLCITFAQH